MPIVRPAGIQCAKWEPASTGSKRCRYYIDPSPAESRAEGLCRLPDELLCVEWVRKNGNALQRARLSPQPTQPGTPPDLVLASPPVAAGPPARPAPPAPAPGVSGSPWMPIAGAQSAIPSVFEPAKGVDPMGLAALEQAGVEVELEAPHLGGVIALVAARTGRMDRSEITFRECDALRMLLECFPGAHVVGYQPRPLAAGTASKVESGNRSGTGLPAAEAPAEAYSPAGSRCSVCDEPQYRTPGGLSCRNGHGGAEPADPLS